MTGATQLQVIVVQMEPGNPRARSQNPSYLSDKGKMISNGYTFKEDIRAYLIDNLLVHTVSRRKFSILTFYILTQTMGPLSWFRSASVFKACDVAAVCSWRQCSLSGFAEQHLACYDETMILIICQSDFLHFFNRMENGSFDVKHLLRDSPDKLRVYVFFLRLGVSLGDSFSCSSS